MVVSHQSAETIGRCLDSIRGDRAVVEMVVVDNASDDGTGDLVARRAATDARNRLLRNDTNRGFSAACNQGASTSHGSFLLFLNPDAFVAADSISRLHEHLIDNPAIGLIGACVVDESGRTHGPQRRREPTWRRSLMTLTGLARFERRWPSFAGIEQRLDPKSASIFVEEVDAVNGAAMMLPRALFDTVRGFDESFFLHAEDLDLCRRVRNAGYRVAIANDVVITHIGGVSGRQRPLRVEWHKTRSLWRYFRKHEPDAGWAIRLLVAAGLGLRLVAKLPAMVLARLRS